jgi:cellulose biosynthesis protein BcsQ
MKVVAVIAKHPGSGQTTVLVNLASGLVRQGYRVLIGESGKSIKLRNWLGIGWEADTTGDDETTTAENITDASGIKTRILNSRLGIDLLPLIVEPNAQESPIHLTHLEKLDYNFLLLHPAGSEYYKFTETPAVSVIICTDLSHDNELEELQALEECLYALGNDNGIDLILPNKINTKEWEQNTQQLFTLADHFGYEKIADPIPH